MGVAGALAAETNFPDGQFRQVSVFMPDNDPVLIQGEYVLLRRGNYPYNIRLPYGYSGRRSRYYPGLFVITGEIDVMMRNELRAATKSDWIIVEIESDETSSRETSMAGFFTAHDHAMNHFRIDPARKIMTGAGAQIPLVASLSQKRPGFAGAIVGNYPPMREGPPFQWQVAHTNISIYSILLAGPHLQSPELGAFFAGLPHVSALKIEETTNITTTVRSSIHWSHKRLYPDPE